MDEVSAKASIISLLDAMVHAWNIHDAEAYTEGLADDVDYTNVFGITIHGRDAVTASHIAFFKGMFAQSKLSLTDMRIRLLREDISAVEARWEMERAKGPSGEPWPKRQGLMNMVAERRDGTWTFSVFHNMDLPAPGQVAKVQEAISGKKRDAN